MTHRTQQFLPWARGQLLTVLLSPFPTPTQQWLTCAYCVPHTRTHLTHDLTAFSPSPRSKALLLFPSTGETLGLKPRSATCPSLYSQLLTILPVLFIDPNPGNMSSLSSRSPLAHAPCSQGRPSLPQPIPWHSADD